jgi:class 3 adenylate cyclase
MKYFFTYLFLLSFIFLFSQSDPIQKLENDLLNQSGKEYLSTAVSLSDEYYKIGNFKRAIEIAKKAHTNAAKLGSKEWMAIALNRQARALIQLPKSKRTNRAEALSNLEQSIKLTTDPDLKLDNLEQLSQIAQMRGRKKDAAKIDAQIAALTSSKIEVKGKDVISEKPKRIFNTKRNVLKKVAAENEELNEQVAYLEAEKANLRKQQSKLKYLLRGKEEEIQEMSEEQMQTELLYMAQERMLDSIVFRGRLDSLVIVQKDLKLQGQESKLAEQNAQIQLKNSQRNLLLALAFIILIIAVGLYLRFQGIKAHNMVLEEKNEIIRSEKQRSEALLLNILPAAIADELKLDGSAKTKYYNQATVLFTDFKNFSQISKGMTPEKLVADLDYCFKRFDQIVEKYGLEKIKTIGDAYMCAGGLPKSKKGHVYDVINAAMEMQDFLLNWKLEKAANREPYFEARLGIHTGPIVAGVVGSKKFAYDIWGDTVNVASRMESSGETGKVNISESTYQLVKDQFDCEYRGKVPAKNVGEIDMYFVENKVA